MIYVFMLLIGVVAGLRAATPLAAISWAGYLGWINYGHTSIWWIGTIWAAIILTIIAIAELVRDQAPGTPSRKEPMQLGARIVAGAICGALLPGNWIVGIILGAVGAAIGTYGGYEVRKRLVAATGGKDLPIALLEDAIAIALAVWIVYAV
jgi:uncharacterized membrane protein